MYPNVRINHPQPRVRDMSPVAQLEQTRSDALWLEQRRKAAGLSAPEARKSVAREVKASVGTIENLVRRRLKRLDSWLRDSLQVLVVRELEAEVRRLTHELETAKRRGDHPASESICGIQTQIATVQRVIDSQVTPLG